MDELLNMFDHNEVLPFVFGITCATKAGRSTANAVIGGYNIFGATANYGSDPLVTISGVDTLTTYFQFLTSIAQKPFIIDHIRLISSNTTQRNQVVLLNHTDANGIACIETISFPVYHEPFSPQTGILDIRKDIKFDENAYFTIPVVAGITIAIAITPKKIVDFSKNLKY